MSSEIVLLARVSEELSLEGLLEMADQAVGCPVRKEGEVVGYVCGTTLSFHGDVPALYANIARIGEGARPAGRENYEVSV